MNESTFDVRIYYEDTDAGGIVYHTNYLKYMERARSEFLGQVLGVSFFDFMDTEQCAFVVRDISISYKKPAKLGEMIQVKTVLSKVVRTRLVFDQYIMKRGQDAPITTAQVVVVCIDKMGKPRAIPDTIRKDM